MNAGQAIKAMVESWFNPEKRTQMVYKARREYWAVKIKALMVAVYSSEEREFDRPLKDYSPEQLETLYGLLAKGYEPNRALETIDYIARTSDAR